MLGRGWREIQPATRLQDIAGSRIALHDLRSAGALQLAAASREGFDVVQL